MREARLGETPADEVDSDGGHRYQRLCDDKMVKLVIPQNPYRARATLQRRSGFDRRPHAMPSRTSPALLSPIRLTKRDLQSTEYEINKTARPSDPDS